MVIVIINNWLRVYSYIGKILENGKKLFVEIDEIRRIYKTITELMRRIIQPDTGWMLCYKNNYEMQI